MAKEIYRTFVCVDFPSEVVGEIARVQEVLGKWKFDGKMTELENLHLTLKFLGEIEKARLEEIGRKLNEIKVEKFEARFDSMGIFSFRGNPRIVWIKIGGKGVFELQKKIDEVLSGMFKQEERFMSHATIARIKYVKDKSGFRRYIEGIGLKEVKFRVDNFKLKTSELKELGPIYKEIGVYKL